MTCCFQNDSLNFSSFSEKIIILDKKNFSRHFIVYHLLSDNEDFISLSDVIRGGWKKLPENQVYQLKSKLFRWLSELTEEEGLQLLTQRMSALRKNVVNFHSSKDTVYYQNSEEHYHEYPFIKGNQNFSLHWLTLIHRLNSILKETLLRGKRTLPLKFSSMRQALRRELKLLRQEVKTSLRNKEVEWQRSIFPRLKQELEQNANLYNDQVRTIVADWEQKLAKGQAVAFPKWRHHTPTIEAAVSIAFSKIELRKDKANWGAFVTSYSPPIQEAGQLYEDRAYGNYCYVLSQNAELQSGYGESEVLNYNETPATKYWISINYPNSITNTKNKPQQVWIGFQNTIPIFPLEAKGTLGKLFSQNVCLLAASNKDEATTLRQRIEDHFQTLWPEEYVKYLIHLIQENDEHNLSFNKQLDFIISRVLEEKWIANQHKANTILVDTTYRHNPIIINPFEGLEYDSEAEDDWSEVQSDEDPEEVSLEEMDYEVLDAPFFKQETECTSMTGQSLEDETEKEETLSEISEGKQEMPNMDTDLKRKAKEIVDEDQDISRKKSRLTEDSKEESKKISNFLEINAIKEEFGKELPKFIPYNRIDLSILLSGKKAANVLKVYLDAQSAERVKNKRSKFKTNLLSKVTTFKTADQLTHLVRTVLPFTIPKDWASLVPRPGTNT